ncbi:MAG: nucleotide exchange factor GrpE [Bacteroidia bacterium]|jgi:molecular chaperone GrpE|nr:nucleotide exchange factor GrpE [Bacteroidia bacterium]
MNNEQEKELTDGSTTENTAENIVNETEQTDNAVTYEEQKAEETPITIEQELAEAKDKYLRLYADFENYKRRSAKERMEFMMTANKEVLVSLIPVLDDFERASKAMEKATEVSAVKEGVELVSHKLKNILMQKGLKEMESTNKVFDSELHEAITNIPAPSDDLKGKVVDTVEKGYLLNERVIRFAKVVVGE